MVAFPEFFEENQEAPDLRPVLNDFTQKEFGQTLSAYEMSLLLSVVIFPSEKYVPNGLPAVRDAVRALFNQEPVYLHLLTENGKYLEMSVAPKHGTWNASYRLTDPANRISSQDPVESYSENVFRLEEFLDVIVYVFRTFFRMVLENSQSEKKNE